MTNANQNLLTGRLHVIPLTLPLYSLREVKHLKVAPQVNKGSRILPAVTHRLLIWCFYSYLFLHEGAPQIKTNNAKQNSCCSFFLDIMSSPRLDAVELALVVAESALYGECSTSFPDLALVI